MATTMEALLKIAAKGEGFKDVENQIKGVETVAGGLNKGLGGIGSILGTITGGVVALGAGLTAAGMVEFAKHSIDAADAMRDLSQKTGVSVENLSRFQQVANQSGTDIESVGGGMVKLSKAMKEVAMTGSGPAADAFRTLGISVTDSSGKLRGVDQVMLDVADKFKLMPDGADKAALAVAMFGKKGAELIPMLNEGKQAVTGLAASMSTEFAKKADAFNDKMEAVKIRFGQIGMAVADQLLPYLTKALDYVGAVGSGILEFVAKNGGFIQSVITGLFDFGKALLPIAIGIGTVITVTKSWQMALQAVAVTQEVLLALQGPKGWATLALGIGVSVGAAYGLNELLKKLNENISKSGSNANGLGKEFDNLKQKLEEQVKAEEAAAKAEAERKKNLEAYNFAIDLINAKLNVQKAILESTSAAVTRQSTLRQADITAYESINNSAKTILQSELQIAKTKEEKIKITLKIMDLDLANAKLQMEATEEQIAAEIEMANLKRRTAWEQLRSVEATILQAKAMGQQTGKLEEQLNLQKIAANNADKDYKLVKQIGDQKLYAQQKQYDANVFQIKSTTQLQLDALNKQDQALNNIVATSGKLVDSSGAVATNYGAAADAVVRLQVAKLQVGSTSTQGGYLAAKPGMDIFGRPITAPGSNTPRFAAGGYVNGPTPALVGEAGPEYVIPANRMQAASSAYLGGARGAAVLQASGGGAAPLVTIQTGPVMQFNGQNYVTVEDLQRATQQVAEGVIGRLRTPSARLALGLR